jgi:hypothetical protein
MPKSTRVSTTTTDLQYAVERLIADGKTTKAEVERLAAERTTLLKSLKEQVAALMAGKVVATVPVSSGSKEAAKPRVAKPKVAKRTIAKTAKKAGHVMTRSDGRTFTTTPKVVAARKAQGRYLAFLRQVPKNEKTRFQAIAKKDGVPVAVVALLKRLGKTGPAKTVAAVKPKGTPAKAVAPAAKPKKKAMPASYYRCAHPGCKNNWFVRGRPYCGEHVKLHGKGKSPK